MNRVASRPAISGNLEKSENFVALEKSQGIYLRNWEKSGNFTPTSNEVIKEAGCCTKGHRFESRVRHGCQAVRLWPHQWLRSKTSRQEVPGSFLGQACWPSCSKFSVVFSKTRINTG